MRFSIFTNFEPTEAERCNVESEHNLIYYPDTWTFVKKVWASVTECLDSLIRDCCYFHGSLGKLYFRAKK